MALDVQYISLDISKQPTPQQVRLGQGDANATQLVVSVYDDGIAYSLDSYSVRLEMRLPNSDTYYSVDGTRSGNVATFSVDETYAATSYGFDGFGYVDILSGDTVICSTSRFQLVVLQNAQEGADPSTAYSNGIIEATERAIAAAEAAEGVVLQAVPTMSQYVKGGAKLGSGLTVSDDTLSLGSHVHAAGDITSGSELTLHADNVKIDTSANNGVSSNTAIGFMSLSDMDDYWAGRVGAYAHSNGSTVSYLGARNHKADGTDVTNYIQAGVTKAGEPYYWMTSPTAFRKALEIVNILTLKSPSTSSAAIDTSANNGAASSAVVFGRTEIMDKNGTWVSAYGSNTQTNGQTRSYIGCNNMKTDGTMATNYLNIGVNKDGSAYYGMTSPAAFRKALGFGDSTWETQDDTGPAVSVANSSWAKLTQVTLTAGCWLVLVAGYAASSNTGRRGFHLSSASSVTAARFLTTLMAPPSGAALYTVIPYLVNPTASTTYNIFGYQNSGGNLNMSALVCAIHIYTA